MNAANSAAIWADPGSQRTLDRVPRSTIRVGLPAPSTITWEADAYITAAENLIEQPGDDDDGTDGDDESGATGTFNLLDRRHEHAATASCAESQPA